VGALKALVDHFRYLLTGKTHAAQHDDKQRLICKRCGSPDTWRVQAEIGWYADLMRARDMKPFECRMCKHRFYYRAARKHARQSSCSPLE
jgi:hypothetical protein